MKNIFGILFSIFSLGSFSQTTALSFSTISNDYLRPGSGAANWNDGYVVPIPPGGSTGQTAGIDRYCRFAWNQIQNDDGSYNWSAFDLRVQIAINAGQKFSFGIMPICEGCSGSNVGGTPLNYPLFLHTQMQGETVKDWASSDMWVPNWNSVNFLAAWQAMMNAIAAHIAATTFNGKHYKDVINYIDIRGYGNFGEWHNYPYNASMPAGTWPTSATLDSIIQYHIDAFPNYPLVILIGAYDHVDATIQIPLDVTYFALTAHNNWGPIGWRRDNWGDANNYTAILENNTGSLNGLSFKAAIMSRFQVAPVTGEPLNGLTDYSDLDVEVKKYGGSSFGNGNISNPTTPSIATAIQKASFDAGARFKINSGTISSTIHANAVFQVTLNISNIGASPAYEKWNATYILKGVTAVVQTWIGKFQPKFFQPGTQNIVDNLSLGSVPPGNYTLYIKIVDSVGYRKAMMISNTGMQADTSYLITTLTVLSSTTNPAPTVSAGADITITAPSSSTTLGGSFHANSPAASANGIWVQRSGPNTATITGGTTATPTVSGLISGTYLFELDVTDNLGGTALDQMQVIVNPALVSPTVTGTSNYTITGPANTLPVIRTITLHGASTYTAAWSNVSGPSTATFTPSNSNSTTIGNLITAGTYITQLLITDNNSQTTTVRDTIVVNATPSGCNCIAGTGALDELNWALEAAHCWGRHFIFDSLQKCIKPTISLTSNYTAPIVQPINTVAFAYSGKSNNKGTGKMTYSFIQVSGPTATVVSTVVSRATVSALQVGTSIFALTGKDDCGAAFTVYDTIVVKPAIVPPPTVKYLVKVVHVPAENQYDLYYSDGSVTYLNILKTFLWCYEIPSPTNPGKAIIFNVTLNDGKYTNTIYQ